MNQKWGRHPDDGITLDDKGATLSVQIAAFEQHEDGTWSVWEQCDHYYGSNYTEKEIEEFAKHLLALIEKRRKA